MDVDMCACQHNDKYICIIYCSSWRCLNGKDCSLLLQWWNVEQSIHLDGYLVFPLVHYHTGGSTKLNARILHLAHMVYL